MSKLIATLGEVDGLFSITQQKYQDNSSMAFNHYHNQYEIYYMLEGGRYYFIKDRTYNVMKGDVVLIDINEVHRTSYNNISDNSERILINFDEAYIEDFTKNIKDISLFDCFKSGMHVIRMKVNDQRQVEALLQIMRLEAESKEKGHVTFAKILLIELLLFINRIAQKSTTEIFEHPSLIHKKISDIVVYINENFYEEITLSFIAQKYFISIYHLSRLFKKVTGFSFIEYLNLTRVRAAQKLLSETSIKVSQIASNTGFDSITHFGRTFKSITGVSPLQYRKQSG